MQEWEYHTIETFRNKTLDAERLTGLGRKGWELAGVTSGLQGPGLLTHTTYYFKRPVVKNRGFFRRG